VLFASAAPADVRPVPAEDHRKALEQLLEPWIESGDSEQEREEQLRKHLVVLTDATCEDIERECARGAFSHVHILAHGMQYQDGLDVRFGLALHDPVNPAGKADPVSGERLATALRPVQDSAAAPLARPAVVTLASCDSGNQGTVAGMGGSIAHALHAAGIPMVVASQFPLSVAGSLLLVRILYNALLWGKDPRVALGDLRRRLYSRFPSSHDWASLTVYMSLPPDFENRLCDVQIRQTMQSMDVQMEFADRATAKLMQPRLRSDAEAAPPIDDLGKRKLLDEARQRMEDGRRRLQLLLERTNDRARVCGLLAATEKRCAEVYYSFSRIPGQQEYGSKWLQLLQDARQHYWEAFLAQRDKSWAVVQYISLDVLLRNLHNPPSDLRIERHEEHNSLEALWTLAHVTSINDLRTSDEQRVRWALGNLVELYLLVPLIWQPEAAAEALAEPAPDVLQNYSQRAVQRAQDLIDRAGPNAFEVYSTRRQILRYDDWYAEISAIDGLSETVDAVLKVLPRRMSRPSDTVT
jgi:hypothetical protein